MNPAVDNFLDKAKKWKAEMTLLRRICLDCGLTEEYKWMHPCYTFQGSNVVLIHGFKAYCALLFHKGVLLSDSEGILVQQTENVQVARQIRFADLEDVIRLEQTIKTYIFEAIEVEKAGVEVKMKKTAEFEMPAEFEKALDSNQDLKSAFEALTPGRKRGYLLYFTKAKQAKTRTSRIEKYIPKIIDGKGLND
ncbi:YdeI/OmpD-associated family protein [Neolewinella persica]|uniref:YdeI/OmpD-associated family protein n=1 Tax=Neolewinella persica TaxID=70998 RepID=UPI00038004A7|nr:YdeI family protein [Neolewinella persica]